MISIQSNNLKKYLQKYLPKKAKSLYLLYNNRPIYNYYKTDFKKYVLISYITEPFILKSINYAHTNFMESLLISKAFKDLDFNVDIVPYTFEGKINYSKYSVIFGFGDPMTKSFYERSTDIITIYYGTGMHVCWNNHKTLDRIKEVHIKKKEWIPESGRIVDKAWSIQTSIVDAIITLGNEDVISSYKSYYSGVIYNIPVTYHAVIDNEKIKSLIIKKDYEYAKFHFIWFGSTGLIHKGLDLLLEYFSEHPYIHLHVCGPLDSEPRFVKHYYHELYELPNIHAHGFVDITSDLFFHLISKCLFVILPSCSEGEPSSVINLMANGMIPLVTKSAGIKIKDFGYLIDEVNICSIDRAIKIVLNTREEELKQRSLKCFEDTRYNHSPESYSLQLSNALKAILEM